MKSKEEDVKEHAAQGMAASGGEGEIGTVRDSDGRV